MASALSRARTRRLTRITSRHAVSDPRKYTCSPCTCFATCSECSLHLCVRIYLLLESRNTTSSAFTHAQDAHGFIAQPHNIMPAAAPTEPLRSMAQFRLCNDVLRRRMSSDSEDCTHKISAISANDTGMSAYICQVGGRVLESTVVGATTIYYDIGDPSQ